MKLKVFTVLSFMMFIMMGDIAYGNEIVTGTYRVPVPKSLENSALFDLPDVEIIENEENLVGINYFLPSMLVRESTKIELTRVEDSSRFMLFEGSVANAACTKTGENIQCLVDYHSLMSDLSRTEEFLRHMELSPEELSGAIDVSRVFREDPVGILTINRAK